MTPLRKSNRPARSTRRARALWARHASEWRAPAEVLASWRDAESVNPQLLRFKVYGDWWDLLRRRQITLIVTREYEHLIIALSATREGPLVSFMPMPHPSGLAVDRATGTTFVASTRNPNQIYELRPVSGCLPRLDVEPRAPGERPLVPVASRYYPGCLYLHDLAFIGADLHANSVGQNAVVRLDGTSEARAVWWPRCVERAGEPITGRNLIQLNSMAAGDTLQASYFSASSDAIGRRRPGDPRYPVDGRGVVFSGATREPVTRGLTRPHSARLSGGALWVANSGYGEFCRCDLPASSYTVVAKAPGWTRGLCFHDDVAFVGTSRVIPRFRAYAPGLDADASVCGVHAVDATSGAFLGGVVWPDGNQVFAVDWIHKRHTAALPLLVSPRGARRRERDLFYAYEVAAPAPAEVP